ncbi:MAG: flippase-like domain-containing protein [Gemmatimonadetes bacterium]|nr:flippase-like domain-containing protein [Gemmatimonadota bacterium]
MSGSMPRIGRASRWFGILSVALSVGVLILVASRVSDARALIDRIPASGHIVALAAVVASLAARALRLIHLSRPSGKRIRWSTALAAHLMGDAAASVTPARSGGDPMRVWVTRRDGFTAAAAAGLVAGEVVGDLLIVVALAVCLAIFAEPVRMVALATAGFSGLMATILLVLAIRGPGKGKEPPPKPLALLGMPRKAWRGVRLASLRFRRTLRGVRRAPAGAQATTLALSVINVGCRLAILPILALSLGGVFSFQRLVAWPLLLLYPGAALPPPGGGGIIEAGFATSLVTDFGPEEMAVALLWWRIYTHHLLALAGALVCAVGALRQRHRSARLRAVSPVAAASLALVLAAPIAGSAQTRAESALATPGHGVDVERSPEGWAPRLGEMMEFRVSIGPVRLGRSRLSLASAERVGDEEAHRVEFELSAPIPFFRIHDRQLSWIATRPFRTLRFDRLIEEGKKRSSVRYHLDRPDGSLVLETLDEASERPDPPVAEVPEHPLDELGLLYELRRHVAQGRAELVTERFYRAAGDPARFAVTGRERVRVPAGRFETIVMSAVVPGMSIFSPEAQARIYIHAEAPHQIVMVKTRTRHGDLGLYLSEFTPGRDP